MQMPELQQEQFHLQMLREGNEKAGASSGGATLQAEPLPLDGELIV